MRKIFFISLAGVLLMTFSSCNQSKKAETADFNLSNLDNSVKPNDDFYQYACGGWMKNNPLPSDYSRYGSFDKLAVDNQVQIRELIEEQASKNEKDGTLAQKIGTLYALGMDSVKLNADGTSPIKAEIEGLRSINDKDQLKSEMANLHKKFQFAFFIGYVSADEKNSDMNIFNLSQGGLGMPDRDYYLMDDEGTLAIRQAYIAFIKQMFTLAGYADEAEQAAEAIMNIETALANSSFTRVELRDSYKNYNKLSKKALQQLTPSFNWDEYFGGIGLLAQAQDSINVRQPSFLKTFNSVLEKNSVRDLQYYYVWNIINQAADYMSDDFRTCNFDFYGKMLSGAEEMRPRWKYVVNDVESALGEAIGQLYVKKYFPAESKTRMIKLVSNLQDALRERIKGLEWMSEATKEKALEKLDAFHVKIGYPDRWRDYSGLEIRNDSYWANIQRSHIFDYDYMIQKAGKPVDKDEWEMTPQTVNAYYNPTTNEICFPAGILQPPFFFANADDALNYGAIGVVIGHEMTHGFDDEGRNFDKNGNLNDWWTEEDALHFTEKTQALATYFDNIIVLDTVHANGALTLGENIADQGGLLLSYAALQKALVEKPTGKIDDFTPEQRFFLAYANVWAGNIRDKEILRRTMQDPHSLGRWRVNGTLPHIQQFFDAFDIKEGDPMFLMPEKRCLIW